MARRFGVAVAWNVSRRPGHDAGMAPRTDFSFLSDLGLQLAAWEETYVSEAGLDRYLRACAWVTSESAKQVATSMTEAIASTIDRTTPGISRAYQYTRVLTLGTSDAVSADAFVLDDQSIVLKHLFGDGRNTRLPGDVGLAKEHILVHGEMIKAYHRPRAPHPGPTEHQRSGLHQGIAPSRWPMAPMTAHGRHTPSHGRHWARDGPHDEPGMGHSWASYARRAGRHGDRWATHGREMGPTHGSVT